MRRGLVIGCGGTVGGAWAVGALVSLRRALDWDPRTAAVIVGTSAGGTLAALLGAGVGVDELLAAHRGADTARPAVRRFFTRPPAALPRLPLGPPTSLRLARAGLRQRSGLLALSGLAPRGRTDASFLTALADDLAPDGGWVAHPATWIVAADLATGARTPFGHPDAPAVPLRDALRATWAVPGWFPPVTPHGRPHLDGGVASTASADLLADQDLDEVVVLAPMAGPARVPGLAGRVEGLLRRPMDRALTAEVAALRATGTRVLRVHPSAAELAAMGPNFMNPARRVAALDAALVHVPTTLAREVAA